MFSTPSPCVLTKSTYIICVQKDNSMAIILQTKATGLYFALLIEHKRLFQQNCSAGYNCSLSWNKMINATSFLKWFFHLNQQIHTINDSLNKLHLQGQKKQILCIIVNLDQVFISCLLQTCPVCHYWICHRHHLVQQCPHLLCLASVGGASLVSQKTLDAAK